MRCAEIPRKRRGAGAHGKKGNHPAGNDGLHKFDTLKARKPVMGPNVVEEQEKYREEEFHEPAELPGGSLAGLGKSSTVPDLIPTGFPRRALRGGGGLVFRSKWIDVEGGDRHMKTANSL